MLYHLPSYHMTKQADLVMIVLIGMFLNSDKYQPISVDYFNRLAYILDRPIFTLYPARILICSDSKRLIRILLQAIEQEYYVDCVLKQLMVIYDKINAIVRILHQIPVKKKVYCSLYQNNIALKQIKWIGM
ncbi:MAG: hypothetical protein HAW62_01510 [Endozoicomonadaceae bacterium]|nr:hypothetical protein [Endozoicomonadaceae bacterium]